MTDVKQLITEHLDIWLTAEASRKSGRGRSSGSSDTIYGVKKLRELILDLAISGKLVTNSKSDAKFLTQEILSIRDTQILNQNLKTKASDEITLSEKNYISVPSNWDWIKLGNIAKFIDYRGKTPKKIESGVPLITAKNVRFGFLDEEPREYISEEDYDEWMTRGFPRTGDLLFTTEAPLGNIAEVNLEYKFALAQRVICFQLHEPQISEFIKILIMSNRFQNKLLDESTGMTATGIKASKLKEIAIPIPPLEEQHRIVAKVDELMQLCDQLEEQQNFSGDAHATLVDTLLKALTESSDIEEFQANWQRIVANFDLLFTTDYSIEQLKQSILQLAVMGKLVKQDSSDEPASGLLKQIAEEKAKLIKEGKIKKSKPLPENSEDEKPFELPNDARWVHLDDLLPNFQNGNSSRGDKDGTNIAVLRLADITNNKIDLSDLRYLTIDNNSIPRYVLLKNDILITRVNGSTDIVGSFTYCNDDINAIYCDHFIRMRLNQSWIDSEYLSIIGKSKLIRSQIESLFITTAGQKTVNQKHIGSILIPLFPKRTQIKIVRKIHQLFVLIEQLQDLQSKLQKTKLQLADALVANAVEEV